MKATEQKIYGRNACLAFAHKYPDAVIRAYCTQKTQGVVGFLLKHLAQRKRAYHIVTPADLDKLSESEHHEEILLLVERPALGTEEELVTLLKSEPKQNAECLLCLDGLANPHNLGSIIRTAAHFGIKKIILFHLAPENVKGLTSGAYHRTAEGGAVHVSVFISQEPKKLFEVLNKQLGFTLAVTTSHAKGAALSKTKLPARLALILGSEAHGISQDIMSLSQVKICIEGTGNVESLNVASAAAILLHEYDRQLQRARLSRRVDKPTLTARKSGKNRKGS